MTAPSKKLTISIGSELLAELSDLKKTEKYSQLSWSDLYRDVMFAGINKMKKKGN